MAKGNVTDRATAAISPDALTAPFSANEEFDLLVSDGSLEEKAIPESRPANRRGRLPDEPRLSVAHRNGRANPVRKR